jgi:NAD(P)-dependent dehydrogenase (short-subunit alcohol dehydrogenase family)
MSSVLITGTSRGIGLATALALGRAGYTVYATMRNPKASPKLAATAEKEKLPVQVLAIDVNSDTSVSETIRSIQQKHGTIDVLVNNAGVERHGSVEELPLAEVRAIMETNYFGALRCIQAVLPEMRERRSGCIVNVSSVGGRISSPPLTAYCASKWALEAMSEGLAQEVKPFNVRVAIVEPGIIDTGMARSIAKEPPPSIYPHAERMAGLFTNVLQDPTPPSLVADKILEIIRNDSWKLRYVVGPDAEGYLQRRVSMTDEEWVDQGVVSEG